MPKKSPAPTLPPPDDSALWAILESTAAETGEKYFAGLVQRLAQVLGTCGAWATEYLEESRRLRALAFWMDGKWIEGYEVDIAGTPCEQVVDSANLVHIPDRLLELFESDAERSVSAGVRGCRSLQERLNGVTVPTAAGPCTGCSTPR